MAQRFGWTRALFALFLFSLLACSSAIIPCMPQPETCNGRDDDCDGTVDEDPVDVSGAVCGTDEGPCVAGHQACVAGKLTCEGEVAPSDEICNNADDDCDGGIDEDLVGCGCTDGGAPGAEVCDNVDNDCDGAIDEEQIGCGCANGGAPTAERCNNLDDDCDGEIDEQLVGCACTGGGSPGVESCNNTDDNCDGAIDEGLARCGCAGGGAPRAELCNNSDDDCDGPVDEDLTGCACTGDGVPGTEVCDGVDNDCDTLADEDNGSGVGCGQFGDACKSFLECESQVCVGDLFERICSQECDPAEAGSCPAGNGCVVGPAVDTCRRDYPACGSDADCAPDQVCTLQEARDGLTMNTECRPPLDPGGEPSAACDSATPCRNNLCPSSVGLCSEVCAAPADCALAYGGFATACILRGFLVHPGDCSADRQCPSAYSCKDGACKGTAACVDDTTCGPHYHCDLAANPKVCVPTPVVDYVGECLIACQGDPDCPAGTLCFPAVLVDRTIIQGYCRKVPTSDTTPTGAGPCGGAADLPCSHGICFDAGGGNTYCSQLCAAAEDCPGGGMSCQAGTLRMGDLGAFPDTLTCSNL